MSGNLTFIKKTGLSPFFLVWPCKRLQPKKNVNVYKNNKNVNVYKNNKNVNVCKNNKNVNVYKNSKNNLKNVNVYKNREASLIDN